MTDLVVRKLRPFLSPRRAALIEQVIAGRLMGIAVLLEGIYDHGNVVAVMRTAEALGVHQVHLVSPPEAYKEAKRVGQGAPKWLDVREHPGPDAAARYFRERGYRLLASDLDASQGLEEIDLSQPIVLVLGNERTGVTPELGALCDATYRIPMLGFTRSLNISCAAAVSMYELTRRWRRERGVRGDLTAEQAAEVRELFYRRAVKRSELMTEEGGRGDPED